MHIIFQEVAGKEGDEGDVMKGKGSAQAAEYIARVTHPATPYRDLLPGQKIRGVRRLGSSNQE